jgi:hypothetical protein
MVPGTVDDPPIVTCVAVEKFHSMYGTPELWMPLKFAGVQEKLLATPLVFTLMISGVPFEFVSVTELAQVVMSAD